MINSHTHEAARQVVTPHGAHTSLEDSVYTLGGVVVVRFGVNADEVGVSVVERSPHVGAGATLLSRHAETSVVRREVLQAVRAEKVAEAVAGRLMVAWLRVVRRLSAAHPSTVAP